MRRVARKFCFWSVWLGKACNVCGQFYESKGSRELSRSSGIWLCDAPVRAGERLRRPVVGGDNDSARISGVVGGRRYLLIS